MTYLHLGPLHPVETVLTLLLAFGPLVLLAVTIWLSKRRHARDTAAGVTLGSAHDRDEPDRGAAGRN
jgi:hypothetical protein